MCILRLRTKFFNISLICVYAPTEEKDTFYQKLEEEYDSLPRHDAKIILGDLNAKIGTEERFRRTIGRESLYESSNDNGFRLINLAISKNMTVRSTWLQRKNIKKATWWSPDGVTENQMWLSRHDMQRIFYKLKAVEVGMFYSDHYLVRIKYRQRIALYRQKRGEKGEHFEVEKLKKDEVVQAQYSERLANQLQAVGKLWDDSDVEGKWNL